MSASRTEERLTAISDARARWDGSRSPGAIRPDRIASRSSANTRSGTDARTNLVATVRVYHCSEQWVFGAAAEFACSETEISRFLDVCVLFCDSDPRDHAGMGDDRNLSSGMRKELRMQPIAARQDGLITYQQLCALGFSNATIARHLALGRLYRVHRGVYVVGRAYLSQAGRFRAALLAIGDDSILSHITAAVHLGFWTYDAPEFVDVTVPRNVRSRVGIRLHRVGHLSRSATTIWRGIRVTTPTRTLLDLAATLTDQEVFERAVHEAQVQKITNLRRLHAEIDRAGPRAAAAAARVAIEIADGAKPTRSRFEDWDVRLLRRHHFPPFETNAHPPGTPGWLEVDVLFEPNAS